MKLLLDTHIFLWFIGGDKRLSLILRQMIANPDNDVYLSVVSLWEAIIKHHIGKLPLPQEPETYMPKLRMELDIASLLVDEASVVQVADLPLLHRDPFDRLLIGQALQHELLLVTGDVAIRAYPTAPVLRF